MLRHQSNTSTLSNILISKPFDIGTKDRTSVQNRILVNISVRSSVFTNGAYTLNELHVTNQYRLRRPIPVQWEFDAEINAFVAYDTLFDWYGIGKTLREAMLNLEHAIVEAYQDLHTHQNQLAPWLKEKFQQMQEYVTNASQS